MKSSLNQYLMAAAVGASAWVAFASIYGWQLQPEKGWAYGAALAVLAAGWLARQLSAAAKRSGLTKAILLASLMMGAALLVPLGLVTGMEGRGMGILFGLIVVVTSNGIPKQAGTARATALRRETGWAMVLGGLAHALCWLLLPLAYAGLGAMLALIAALLYIAVRLLRARSDSPPA